MVVSSGTSLVLPAPENIKLMNYKDRVIVAVELIESLSTSSVVFCFDSKPIYFTYI